MLIMYSGPGKYILIIFWAPSQCYKYSYTAIYSESYGVLCFHFLCMHIVSDTNTYIPTTNVPTPPALGLGTRVPRQKGFPFIFLPYMQACKHFIFLTSFCATFNIPTVIVTARSYTYAHIYTHIHTCPRDELNRKSVLHAERIILLCIGHKTSL